MKEKGRFQTFSFSSFRLSVSSEQEQVQETEGCWRSTLARLQWGKWAQEPRWWKLWRTLRWCTEARRRRCTERERRWIGQDRRSKKGI